MRLSGQNLHAGMSGDQVAELQGELTRLGFTIPEAERHDQTFGVGTAAGGDGISNRARTAGHRGRRPPNRGRARPARWQQCRRTDPCRRPCPSRCPRRFRCPRPAPDTSRIRHRRPRRPAASPARVYLDYGAPAADLRLRAYRRGFGGTAARLGEETRTGPDGRYRLPFDADGAPVNLELRAVQSRGNRVSEVSLTDTVFAVAKGDVLNVVAPSSVRPLGSEYGRLLADVERHLQGRRLGEAKETDEQADLTLLQESTGWDARLVALAASAEHVAAETGVTPTAAYAMLRAGLPDDPVGLAGVSANAVTRALGQGAAAGVVDLDKTERDAAVDAFTSFVGATRLAAVAPGALSSQGEMLAAAGLSADAAARFDEIEAANAQRGGDAAQLWRQVKAAGLPVDALQRTGKLGYLTLNNASLTSHLQQELSDDDLGPALVAGELYRPQAWEARLTDAAGGDDDALAALVPPAFPGKTTAARVRAYAEDLARKVRVSYPTNVVAHMVATEQLSLGDTDAAGRADVATFLDRAAGLGLALGRTPVSAMVRDHGDRLLAGVPAHACARGHRHGEDAAADLPDHAHGRSDEGALGPRLPIGARRDRDVAPQVPGPPRRPLRHGRTKPRSSTRRRSR